MKLEEVCELFPNTTLDKVGDYVVVDVEQPNLSRFSKTQIQAIEELRKASVFMDALYAFQSYEDTLPILKLLSNLDSNIPDSLRKDFDTYRAMVQLNFGPHDQGTHEKFIPLFDKEQINEIIESCNLGFAETYKSHLLVDRMFDMTIDSRKPEWGNQYSFMSLPAPEELQTIKEKFNDEVEKRKDLEYRSTHPPIFTHQFSRMNVGDLTYDVVPFYDDIKMKPYIQVANSHLIKAAELVKDSNPGLHLYILEIVKDMVEGTWDYHRSDQAILNLNGDIQLSIGPVETYSDHFLNKKADFQSIVSVVDNEAAAKLELLSNSDLILELERNLPTKKEYLHQTAPQLGTIILSDALYMGGAAGAGPKTAAHSLPNPPEIQAVGTKKNMFMNIMRHKFDQSLVPSLELVLGNDVAKSYDIEAGWDAFTWFIIGHEVSHAFANPEQDPEETISEFYHPIEEAKADTSGMYNMSLLHDKGIISDEVYAISENTYVAGLFRSIRLGPERAHGKSNRMQLSYLIEHGGLEFDGDIISTTEDFHKVLGQMVNEIIEIEIQGDSKLAEKFLEDYNIIGEAEKTIVRKINDANIPIDLYVNWAPIQ